MVREPIQKCGGHFSIDKNVALFCEREVGGKDHAASLRRIAVKHNGEQVKQ